MMSSAVAEESLEATARRMLLERWRSLAARMESATQESRALRELRETDWEDQAASVATAERLDRLVDNERLQLALVKAALDRLDDGTWGWCMVCGQPIKEARLRSVPEATRCSRCTNYH
jgi:RNA polymerase-binding transcription factor DksA